MSGSALATFVVFMVAVTNPIGNLAIFAGMTAGRSDAEKRKIAITAATAVLVIFLVVTWGGNLILKAFGITIWAFEGAGGLILLLLGLTMLHSKTSGMQQTPEEAGDAKEKDSIGVVPLAIPIVGGPAALTTVIVHSTKFPTVVDRIETSAVVLGISILILIAFLSSTFVTRLLGTTGINIVTRIMGIILAAIGFGMIGNAVKAMLAGHV
ncbi:MAG: NAAT family transporter [Alphaproteobacteria bacterium]|nr:NAAT family transporter [Alphaproteobacteria bacterium]